MKRCISLILSAVLLLSCIPVPNAMATEEPQIQIVPEDLLSLVQSSAETEETSPTETTSEETTPKETISEETTPKETISEETVPKEAVPEETIAIVYPDYESMASGITSLYANKTSGTTGDCTWRLDGTVLTISGNGKMADHMFYDVPPWGVEITKVIIEPGVTNIGRKMFYKCTALESVEIPNTVTRIDMYAFYGCTALQSITIPESVEYIDTWAFYTCTALTDVTIYAEYAYLVHNAFAGCDNIRYLRSGGIRYLGNPENPYAYAVGLSDPNLKTANIHPDTKVLLSTFTDCTSLTKAVLPEGLWLVGYEAFSGCSGLTEVTLPSTVRQIDRYAFSGCTKLKTINIPNGVTTIGEYAFHGTAISDVEIPESVKRIDVGAFAKCTNIYSFTIPETVEYIGMGILSGCSNVQSVKIPFIGAKREHEDGELIHPFGYLFGIGAGVLQHYYYPGKNTYEGQNYNIPASLTTVEFTGQKLPAYAFENCKNLKTIHMTGELTTIGMKAFAGCIGLKTLEIPDTVSKIGTSMLMGCTGLQSLSIPFVGVTPENLESLGYFFGTTENYSCTAVTTGGVTYYVSSVLANVNVTKYGIGEFAFQNCVMLKEVTLPVGMTTVPNRAFSGCSGLLTVVLPATVTQIGTYAFNYCTNLENINIPSGLTYVGNWAFSGCTALPYVTNGDGIYLGNSENPYLMLADTTSTTLKSFAFLPGTKFILSNAFDSCTQLTSITVPNTVLSIGSGAFYNCKVLTTATLSEALTTIETDTFYGCSKLSSITIPKNVTAIGANAFSGCSNLTSVKITDVNAWSQIQFRNNIANPIFYAKSLTVNGTTLTNLELSDQVTEVSPYAFYNCQTLRSVYIPDSVQTIGKCAFAGCTNLQSMTIPFVGEGRRTAEDTWQYPFGYIFGTTSQTGTSRVSQDYYGSSTAATTTSTYYIPKSLKTVTVTGGEILRGAFQNCGMLTSITIPDVSSIGREAFYYCKALKSFSIPASVKEIGIAAFQNCEALTQIVIPQGVTTIQEETFSSAGLVAVTIPGTVTHIGSDAFRFCSALKSVVLSEGVTSVGDYAFDHCSALTSVTLPGSLEKISYSMFGNCSKLTSVTMPEGISAIEDRAFNSCTYLNNVVIPNSVTTLGFCAFEKCTALSNLTFGSGLKEIGEGAFYGCTALRKVNLPSGLTTLGEDVFSGCTGLYSVVIPDSVTSIGKGIFARCTSLQSLTIPFVGASRKTAADTQQYPFGYLFGTSSVTGTTGTSQTYYDASTGSIISVVYYIPTSLKTVTVTGGEILHGAFMNCQNLTQVTISDVTTIGSRAFFGCKALQSFTIPDTVITIEENAFSYCDALRAITIPESVTSVGNDAFSYSKAITQVSLPETVTQWGKNVFAYGSALKQITLPQTMTEIPEGMFRNCTALTSFAVPEHILKIGSYAFSGCTGLKEISFPEHLTEIGTGAFFGCTGLTTLVIPNSVQTINNSAFGGCSALRDITIPFVGQSRTTASDIYQYPFGYLFGISSYTGGTAVEQVYYGYDTTSLSKTTYYIPTSLKSVTVTGGEILYGAFRNCKMLTSITLPSGITSIETQAFYGCTGLTSITLPETVQTIGKSAFYGCTGLKTITLPERLTTISNDTFYNCSALTTVVWPENLSSIGNNAFYNCKKLVINTWPQTLTSIGDYAFSGCTAMTELKLPEGLQTIGSYVFQSCTGLTKVEIPDSVTEIGSYVLSRCGYIRELTIPFVGDSRKTASDKQQYPLGYLFGSTSYTGGVSTKQYYYGSSTTSTTYSTYYIPSSLKRVQVNGGQLLYGAFYNCANIQTIALGENVLVVNPDAFIGTNGLEAFEVDINNPNYCSYNRILYNKDKTEVIWNPTKHTFVLTINYMYADGTPAGQTIVKRLRTGDAYNAAIPEILGYSTIMTSVSGTMPFQDLVIDVVYYENPVVARGQCTDTLSWTMYKDGMLVFRGTGAMPDYQDGTAPWAAYAQQVKIVYLDPRVTSIGAYAFQNCSHLTYVDYGYSVDTVGAYAFAGCSALTSFSLPESVTEVAQGAFSGCTGLKAVVIPDNITAIGDEAFRGCTNLVQATIGGNVTEIGSNAFTDCPGLTQIYFRGEPATVGSEPFGSVVGKVVFYYSTVSGWDEQIDGNSEWHGYTAFPYNAISGEDVDLDSLYIIKVVDKHNNPLANAWITLGDQAGETDHNGLAHFDHKPTQPEYLKIECSNHRDFVDQEFTTTSTQLMDVIEMTDKPSYIQGIRMNQRSIVTSVEVLDSAKNEQVRITVGGYSKYKIIKYELCQGSRVIASYSPKNPTSGNGEYTFSVSANSFEEGQTVLVRMYTSDGQSVASSLNIDVVHLAVLSEAQIMDEFSNLSITIGLGGMGEYKVPFTVTGSGEEMVYVSITGRTIRVGINLDLAEIFGKDEEKDTPIGLIHKMVDNAMKNNVTDKTGVIFDLCGYLELEYLGDGEYFIKTSYVKVSVGVKIGVRAQASFHGIVGVYFEASVSAKGTLELKISRVTPEEGFKFDELNFSPEVGMGIEGGAYILWGAGSAGIYGELTMGFTLGIIPEFDIKTVYVSGEIGVKWSLLWGVFGNKHVIASGDIYRWPSDYQPQEIALFLRRMQNDLDAYTVNDRSYLEERSDWQGSGEYLQTGIYDQVAPKTVTCGNTTMMLWLDDNAQRDVANFQTLYYSLYENGTWTQPIAVDDNGTFDCEFDVCTDGRKIYVLYTERATVASNVATMDVSDIESLMAFANGVEVMVSEYENGRFSTPRKLTNNNICETMPKISLSGGKITAAWLETNNVGMGEDSEINTLRTLYLNAETEEQTTTISEEKTIGSMTVVEMLGQNCTAYTVDADGSGETTDDQVLVLAIALGEQHHLDTGNITDVHAATIKGCDVLTWNKNGRVYMLADPNGSAVCLSPEGMVVDAYQILTAGNDTVLLFVNGGTVYSLFLDETGALTQPVRMVSEEGNISGFSATYENGTIRAVYTQTTAQIQNSTMHTVSNLRNVVLEFHTDITLNSIDYQILDAKAMTELMVTAQVINSGSNRVDYLEVNLIDPEGKTVYSAQYVVEMPSGSSAECRIPLVLPQTLVTGDYVLEILPCRGMTRLNDANLQDNSTKLTLAYTDLSVSAEQKIIGVKNYIALTVSNLGNTATHGKIEVFAPDRSGRLIADIQTEGAILPGQMQQYFVDIHALTSKADALVTCVVTAAYNDPVTLNDTDTVKLLHLQTDGFVADPGQAVVNPELEMTTGNFDKYHPQDLTVTIKTGAEEFSGIDGLIKGTDYIVNYKTGIVKVMASYLAGLQTGRNTLMFRFNYGNAASATRAYVLSVTDSTPIPLSGSVAIAGDPMVGLTVTADLSGLSHPEASVTYSWTVDGECVSTDRSYTILPSDKEQTLELTVTGCDGYAGSLHVQTQVTLQQKNAPVAPVVSKVEADAITVIRMTGIQYSLDGQTWQSDNVFADLQPNTAYTVYARYAETETSYASEPSSTTVTTPKYARTISAPTQFTPVTGVMHFGGAIPSAAATDGQISYGYSMTDDPKTVAQWSEQGILPKENTPTEYYVFARITGGEKYDDAVSIGCLVQAHVHQYTETVVKPTISEQGYTLHTCTGCGDSYKDSFVDKLTYIVGDVNRDGRVNTQDRILLARYLAKWIGYDAEKIDLLAADVNGDGRVNTQDRIILARYLAKWIGYEKLPADN